MTLNEQQVREAYERNGGDLAKTAAELGLPTETIRSNFNSTAGRVVRAVTYDPQPTVDHLGRFEVGRRSLRDKIVAVRQANMPWRQEDQPKIAAARRQYDRGRYEVMTGRDGDWIILYAVKRRTPVAPRNYFYEARIA